LTIAPVKEQTVEQIPFGTNDFAENPEPRVPSILLLDVSGSMAGERIAELNAGLTAYKDHLAADSLASKRVEVAIVTFGGVVQTLCDFTTAESFNPPVLATSGNTPMGAAIREAVEMLQRRKEMYRAHGISYYRPWIFLITDGGPTDEWKSAADLVKQGEASKSFSFFVVAVEGANTDVLKQICARAPLNLKGLQFRKLFEWLSHSQRSVSRSAPGENVQLSNPTGPEGWAFV
jgi:uncharacterized protein YegL